jgi:NAD(P)-dependent dehydrogenase (short-subunit alcohol dehydrogenase family)
VETALVAGANRGIGLELTKQLLRSGRKVIATCRDDAGGLEQLRDQGRLELLELDVGSDKSAAQLKHDLGETTVDLVFCNAGNYGGGRQSIGDVDMNAWREAFEVNTLGPFRVVTALRKSLARSTNPRVLVISSQMGALSRKSRSVYAYRSTKAAANKVAQLLALDLEDEGITVCPVHPGWVRTDMGGPSAEISAEESAAGLVSLAESLTLERSGRFWTWEGKEHAW